MESQQQLEKSLACPECGSEVYQLPESSQLIYVCKNCGASIDGERISLPPYLKETRINAPGEVLIGRLFNSQFMRKYTKCETLNEFIRNSNLLSENAKKINYKTIENLPKRSFNKYIKIETQFRSWEEMFGKAVECYLKI